MGETDGRDARCMLRALWGQGTCRGRWGSRTFSQSVIQGGCLGGFRLRGSKGRGVNRELTPGACKSFLFPPLMAKV